MAIDQVTKEVANHTKLIEIPSPAHQTYFGLLGHAPDLDPILPVATYWQLMDKYDPIFKLDLGMPYPRVFVGSRDLVDEMADESRFTKFTHRLHKEMRSVVGDGLFSAESTSKAWWKAHRVLLPAFGPIGLSRMFDDMQDLSAQLVLKWDRFGPDHEIECIEDTSRLAFDTVGLCCFGYRFNEFYNEAHHPLLVQLKAAAIESGRRANRPEVLNHFYYKEETERQVNIVKIKELCKKIVRDRIENPKPEARDLLNIMVNAVDRETGEKMDVENIEYQIPTFFGAGFETTSATLAFIYYFLCNNPKALLQAQQEVDQIVGDKVVSFDMIPSLKYLDAVIKESLRLQHPSSLLTRFAIKDTVMGGKYFVHKGQMVSGVWRHFHRDPEVWGDDADQFRPERMLHVDFQKLPPNAWKPFGDGLRACIGRGFAEQEMLINLAMILQKFDLEKVDPDYQLRLRGQMALKPIDFKIRARRRPGRGLMVGIPGGGIIQHYDKSRQTRKTNASSATQRKKPITVIFGGNMGTCESLAQELIKLAPDYGLDVVDLRSLDAATDALPVDRSIVIITPSYDGRPPDNGKKFIAWIEELVTKGHRLPASTNFAVFGVGNSDWGTTFHRIPRQIDQALGDLGAKRMISAGFANVKQDVVGPWETWSEQLCMALSGQEHTTDPVGVEVQIIRNSANTVPRASAGERLSTGIVTANRELADTSVGMSKRHVDIRLPLGCTYRSGDHLVLHGRNPEETVVRVLKRFMFGAHDVMSVHKSKKEFLPMEPIAVKHFLLNCVELSAPITQKQLALITSRTDQGSPEWLLLEKMQNSSSYQNVLDKRYSIIDILEEFPGLDLPFGVYIDMLLPMTPRLFSIASSPLVPSATGCPMDGLTASVTFDVFEGPATSGHGTFRGVASSYLARCKPGDEVSCLTRSTIATFHLPSSSETPIIMFAAGSGVAPMRAYIQERAALRAESTVKLGPALLFYGCRHPDKDFLYRSEFAAWEAEGLVEVIACFSKPGGGGKKRYVHDGLWEHRDRAWKLFNNGAKILVCGSASRVGRSTADTWRRIFMEKTGKGEAESHEWLDDVKTDRYATDTY